MDGPSYRYYPLNEEESQFRLVTILPGNWADEVQCTLKTWSWEGRPSYEALSYVWGNASDRRRIWLDNTPFYATANLEHALRFIRQPYPRTLWIDAICVNQEDLDERSSQVQLMRRTYREASNVVFWIGNEGAESRLAFHLLHLVDKLVNGPNPPPTGQRAVASLYYDILMRPYWERAWIIQEV
ncbi:HET-domain-containing protein, partial [Thozetella sp. PMI_491]